MALSETEARERAAKVRLILYDVDGVLTDGTIWVVPTGVSAPPEGDPGRGISDGGFGIASRTMAEMKGFSAHDGMGVSIARTAGIQVGFITKRQSQALEARARDLKVDFLFQGQARKMDAVAQILAQTGFALEELAFVGDDIIDVPVMRAVGFAVAVADARAEAKAAAHWITPSNGGRGAGRDVVDFVLDAKGIRQEIVERYLASADPKTDIGTGNM